MVALWIKLNSVRLWEQPEMKVGSCRICWSHIKKKKIAGKEKISWKKSELGLKNAMFQSFMRVGMLHSLSFHLAWASKPSLPAGMHSYLQRKGIVQGGSEKNTQRYREKSRETIHKLPWDNAIALPKQRFCFSRCFLFYIVFLLKIWSALW